MHRTAWRSLFAIYKRECLSVLGNLSFAFLTYRWRSADKLHVSICHEKYVTLQVLFWGAMFFE